MSTIEEQTEVRSTSTTYSHWYGAAGTFRLGIPLISILGSGRGGSGGTLEPAPRGFAPAKIRAGSSKFEFQTVVVTAMTRMIPA